jgi:phosphoribosylglycinamide formyltransferase-1
MRLFEPAFIQRYAGRMINVHPALLPAFPGLDVQAKALEHGVKISGCTVHFVDEGTDTGPIIVQRAVPVLEDDSVETLAARILAQEHLAYIEAIRLIAQGRVRIEGRRVRIT